MIIRTARCMIRSFCQNDIDAFMDYRNDEAWMRFQDFKCRTRAEYEHALLRPEDTGSGIQLAVTDPAAGHLLGDPYT